MAAQIKQLDSRAVGETAASLETAIDAACVAFFGADPYEITNVGQAFYDVIDPATGEVDRYACMFTAMRVTPTEP